ncbi:L-seryl-tRNA(Sec) selenium transferase [Candidatus Poribacteria bacterium]|nr:L-seryl-tRNA(Sec) selenium transferase [Candidatus Poribacteria bacterium]
MTEQDRSFIRKYITQIPSVGKFLEHQKIKELMSTFPRTIIVESINQVFGSHKKKILSASREEEIADIDLSFDTIFHQVSILAEEKFRPSFRRIINATGNVLNGKMGRTPLNNFSAKVLAENASGYISLDAKDGKGRDYHIQNWLSKFVESEDCLVVNNNSAAVMLILNTIANQNEVIVSRGQLIDSDGFRLPEVIDKSGAKLVSVGATNKTHLRDYTGAIRNETGAIMRVNKSSYQISGFSRDVSLDELIQLGKEYHIPVIDNIGNGFLFDMTQYGLPDEPSVFNSLKAGADIVCFSGDKFLGGPQAGIITGNSQYISMMRENPLYRIMRVGKLTLITLESTLMSYLDMEKITDNNTTIGYLLRSKDEIENLVKKLLKLIGDDLSHVARIDTEDGFSYIPSHPNKFATKLVIIKPESLFVEDLDKRLKSSETPVFGIIKDDKLVLDLRTLRDNEIEELALSLKETFLFYEK